MNIKNYYKNKRILVTGDTGFCGTWLSLLLLELGAKVYGYSLFDKKKHITHAIVKNLKNYQSNYADLRDKKKLKSYILKIKPSLIFHLAAQPLVIDAYKDFDETLQINLIGTNNLLDICNSSNSVKKVLVITTDKVYKESENKIPYNEKMPLGGYDPYSASKSMVEILCETYNRTIFKKKIKLFTARGGNIIGGGDFSENRIIPDIFKSIKLNKNIKIRNPNYTRPWQHVIPLVYGYVMLMANNSINPHINNDHKNWNFGPDYKKEITVLKLSRMFLDEWKKKNSNTTSNIIFDTKRKLYESSWLNLNSNKSKKILNWKYYFDVENSVKSSVNWYHNYIFNKKNLLDLMVKEIRGFITKVD